MRRLWGGARDRRGDRTGFCGRGCTCRGHRSRPERRSIWPARSRNLSASWPTLTDYAAVGHAAEEVEHRFGQCDHVVFAVGAGSGKFGFPFWKLEPADWEPVLKINLIGAVNVAHAFAPAMAAAARATRHR